MKADGGQGRPSLSFGSVARAVACLAVVGAAPPVVAQERVEHDTASAVLEGTVLVEGSGRPLPTALVELVGQGLRVVADSLGRFRLAGIAPGPDTLRVVLLEFRSEPIPVTVAPGGTHRLELVLAYPTATLEELLVQVAGARGERMRGFERRRRRGIGSFLTRDEIERRRPPYLSWLFWGLPRVRVRDGSVRLDTRGVGLTVERGRTFTGASITQMRDTGSCNPTIFVDGVKRGPLTEVDDFRPEEVEGIEIYASPFIPARFSDAFNRCGSIVIWRRRGRSPS